MAETSMSDFAGLVVGLLLTLFVYSYVVKDNPMYRLAVHILIGVSAGFAVVVIFNQVLIPMVESAVSQDDGSKLLMLIVPVVFALLLLTKLFPRIAWIGNSSMAVIISVGAAVGLLGAIIGTLIPQITATYQNGLITLIVALLTVIVLAYFHFTGRFVSGQEGQDVPKWYQYVSIAGKFVMTIALAGVFAGLLSTSLVLLGERLGYYFDSFRTLITG